MSRLERDLPFALSAQVWYNLPVAGQFGQFGDTECAQGPLGALVTYLSPELWQMRISGRMCRQGEPGKGLPHLFYLSGSIQESRGNPKTWPKTTPLPLSALKINYGYSPDRQEQASRMVPKQHDVLCRDWAVG